MGRGFGRPPALLTLPRGKISTLIQPENSKTNLRFSGVVVPASAISFLLLRTFPSDPTFHQHHGN